MSKCKPMERIEKYAPAANSKSVNKRIIQEMLGSLQYLACKTRPDIVCIVNRLSQEVEKPTQNLLNAVKNVWRYLKHTRDLAVEIGQINEETLVVSVDASFGNETRSRSRSGCVMMLYGSPIFWKSQVQKVQALSTAEAELSALTSACEEIEWIKPLIEQFNVEVTVKVLEDNQAAIAIVQKPRNKKLEVKSDYIRDRIEYGDISLIKYQPSELQAADALTKVVDRDATRKLGLVRFQTKNPGNVNSTSHVDGAQA